MVDDSFNFFDWYFFCTDSSPSTQVWSSKRGQFVVLSDSGYVAFLAAGNTAITYPTIASLLTRINDFATTLYQKFLFNDILDTNNVALTNYYTNQAATTFLANLLRVKIAAAGKSVTLPQVNLPVSWPIGMQLVLHNWGSDSFAVKDFGGTTIVTIGGGARVEFTLRSTGSVGGTWDYVFQFTDQVANFNEFVTGFVNGAITSAKVAIGVPRVSALVDGATPALDASLGDMFTLTAAGDRTIAVPSSPSAWQRIIIAHTASGANRTLALNTGAGGFRFGSDITGLTATVSGKTDYIGAVYNSTSSRWDVVSYMKGF